MKLMFDWPSSVEAVVEAVCVLYRCSKSGLTLHLSPKTFCDDQRGAMRREEGDIAHAAAGTPISGPSRTAGNVTHFIGFPVI